MRNSMLVRFFLVAFLTLFSLPASALVKYDDQTHTLSVIGNTTKDQVLAALFEFRKYEVSTVVLWGNGGNFYAGLVLGRAIRREGATVVVPKGKNCISSCAVAALGSENIILDGDLLFHRPYLSGMSFQTTIEEHAGMTGIGYIDYTSYLIEMGYVIEFVRLQIADTSPCKFLKVSDSKTLEIIKGKPLDKMGGGLQHINWCYDQTR